MCGLCGILQAETHWAEKSVEQGQGRTPALASTARRERMARVAYLNRLLAAYACAVSDWQGAAYVLSTFTGKTEIVSNLAEIWQKVEQLTGTVPDPLLLTRQDGRIAHRHDAA
jgi:hypothetical protein